MLVAVEAVQKLAPRSAPPDRRVRADAGHFQAAAMSSHVIKACVVGDGGVGKSSITLRYLRDEFSEVRIDMLANASYRASSLHCSITHTLSTTQTLQSNSPLTETLL